MASMKKQTIQKRKRSEDVATGVGKKLRKAKVHVKTDSDNSDDDEQELEGNFAIISKNSSLSIAKEEEEEYLAEEEDEEGLSAESEDDPTESDSDSTTSKDPLKIIGRTESINTDSKTQTEDEIKKELASMSFEEIMKLQSKVGTKVYNEIAYGTSKGQNARQKKNRLNKNRPMEESSKRPVAFLRKVVGVKKKVSRDPRFDDLSGEFKPHIFEKTYKFITDIKQTEKEVVQKKLKKVKGAGRKEQLQFLLKRLENQEEVRLKREQQREKELEVKRRHRELAGKGQKPYFLKNSDKKKLELAQKYGELKKSGKLENFLSKKRKRNATKDRRKLPFQSKDQ